MTKEKITALRIRCWKNMFRIALRYPQKGKRRQFLKWSNKSMRLLQKMKRILDSQNH